MKRFVLIKVDYQKYMAIPLEDIGIIERMRLVAKSGGAFEPIEGEEPEIIIVDAEKLSAAKIEESYKQKSEQYYRWWSDGLDKVRKLEEELKSLKNGGASVQ
jgi:hypothetical protein